MIKFDIKNAKFNTNNYKTFKIFKRNNNLHTTINVYTCCICGNYVDSSKSMEEKIYCKCTTDIFNNKCKSIHRDNFKKVLDQLIFTMYDDICTDNKNDCSTFTCSLEPSRYSHGGECSPNPRTCYLCWRYWCSCCGGGVWGMYGRCIYKRCRIGRKNCNLEH